jgi:peptide/nickel transport system substrate-binding protein
MRDASRPAHPFRLAAALTAGLCAAAPCGSIAADVAIGLAAPPTSFDPHYHTHIPSFALHRHVFEPLIDRDATMQLGPALALGWAALPDGGGWEFRLDPAARFHDGAPVTAADVAASIARLPKVPSSPGRLSIYTGEIAAVEILDAHRLRLRTHGPAPLLPQNLASVLVVPERAAREATTADFNAGRAAIGSGPYRLREYTAGERVVLERNAAWRGGGSAEPWERVTFRIIPNDSARIAALRANDVQLIESVPARDAASLAAGPDTRLSRTTSVRLIFISLDQGRDASPGIADAEGRPLTRNPLKDRRVRRALSLAIDREAIVRQVMEGQAAGTGQLMPAGLMGHDPGLRPDAYDPAQAGRLLAEAGWGQGFRLTLAGPGDRYVNDERIIQAVAQGWERAGIRTRVEAMPSALFFGRLASGAFSAALVGWATATDEPNTSFVALLATPDRTRGRGAANPMGYSNPRLDALIDRALATLDREARAALWRQATRLAVVEDAALLPLHHQVNTWAMRRGLGYAARADELTLAMGLRPAP